MIDYLNDQTPQLAFCDDLGSRNSEKSEKLHKKKDLRLTQLGTN